VVNTDHVSCILATQLNAKALLMVIENDHKFLSSGISTEKYQNLSLGEFQKIMSEIKVTSNMVQRKLTSTIEYLQSGGEYVVISTLENLSETLKENSGLWISIKNPTIDLSNYF
jgi:carbamate kinase